MRINTNVSAMNAHRQLGINTTNGAKSMERLSSGLRINRAGDDAAGLAISEKMRGQVRGLNQASRNAQDGISLIQTAEGALTETHAILQRVRELAVQATNDTNTIVDRQEIQKEVDQLLLEVDRIANTTEFNQKKLLNGELRPTGTRTEKVNFENKDAIFNAVGITTAGTSTNATYSLEVTGVQRGDAATIQGIIVAAQTGVAGNAITIQFEGDAAIAAGFSIDVTDTAITVNLASDGTSILTTQEEITAAINAHAEASALVRASGGDGTVATAAAATSLSNENITRFNVDWSDHTGQTGRTLVDANATSFAVGDFTVTLGQAFQLANVNDTATFTARENDQIDQSSTLRFQIGANSSQNINVGIAKMDSAALFVKGLNVSDAKAADAAVSAVNMAIEDVSAERSKLGAVQNRLEHTIANLGVASENLSAAESRVRDVDMAAEMMQFTKANILNQAATAMLAQANTAPSAVLQLLG